MMNMSNNRVEIFIEMEREGINPFSYYGSKKEGEEKVREVIKYLVRGLKEGDELYYMKHRYEQVLRCPEGRVIGINLGEEYREEMRSIRGGLKKIWIRDVCGHTICLNCSEENRAEQVEKINRIIEDSRSKGEITIMVTIKAPEYIRDKIGEGERLKRYSKAIESIIWDNTKAFKKQFYTDRKAVFTELPIKVTDFKMMIHSHILMTFKNEEDLNKFKENVEKFKDKVYRAMSKQYEIENKEYYRDNCVYISDRELEDAEYLRKAYGKNRGMYEEWGRAREDYFSQLNSFDKDKGVFSYIGDREEGLIRQFYQKVYPTLNRRGNNCFCYSYEDLVWIGGKIEEGDRRLKDMDYERYKRVMILKTWAIKIYIRAISNLYEEGKKYIVHRLIRIGRNYYKGVEGGIESIKEGIKERRIKMRKDTEERDRAISRESRVEEEIKRVGKEDKKELIREESKRNIEDKGIIKKGLIEYIGMDYEKVEDEIFYRDVRVLRIGSRLHRYMARGVYGDNWLDCMKGRDGKLDIKEGLKKLYEFTEEHGIDRSQIFISEYKFKGDEYERYFPKKVESDKSIDRELRDKLGITLQEYDNLGIYYNVEELEGVIEELKGVYNSRDFSEVGRILNKMRE